MTSREACNEWLASPEAQRLLGRYEPGSNAREIFKIALALAWNSGAQWGVEQIVARINKSPQA